MTKSVMIAALCAAAGLAGAQVATINGSGNVAGNGNSGFGGVIGPGSMDVVTLADGTVNLTLNRGGAEFFNQMVIYIDAGGAGFGDTSSLNDIQDGNRLILSGANGGGSTDIAFGSAFTADFGIAVESGFSGLFDLEAGGDGSHNFVAATNTGFASSDATITWSFNMADIGLSAGDSFKFVANYFNAFDGGGPFRSDEWIGAATIPAGNTAFATVQLGDNDFVLVNSVPSPGALGALGLAGLVAARRRR